jgi:hypothetical protein
MALPGCKHEPVMGSGGGTPLRHAVDVDSADVDAAKRCRQCGCRRCSLPSNNHDAPTFTPSPSPFPFPFPSRMRPHTPTHPSRFLAVKRIGYCTCALAYPEACQHHRKALTAGCESPLPYILAVRRIGDCICALEYPGGLSAPQEGAYSRMRIAAASSCRRV